MPTDPREPPSPPPQPFQRLPTQATWDDLVLPPDELAQLHAIVDRVVYLPRLRASADAAWSLQHAHGTSALFVGASGTGKTLAAEVLARELGLDLWRVDLSAVVSQYVGETEKNLARVFAAAQESGAILLFDDADALLGARSEVKDSHDRYANLEITDLLQRLESHAGLAILTTNMRHAIDPAFMRRMTTIVHFPAPDAACRERIWRRLLPASADVEHLDVPRLARMDLTGGTIRDIATRAACHAAAQATPITMPLILEAAAAELRKLGRTPGAEHA